MSQSDQFPLSQPSAQCLASSEKTAQMAPTALSGYCHKSIWHAKLYESLQSDLMEKSQYWTQIEKLKEDVRDALNHIGGMGLLEKLEFIDASQRLGIDYHFKNEIKRALDILFKNFNNDTICIIDDLHTKALCIRLLRQHGYQISQDIFNCFKDDRDNFKPELCHDIKGMLSLYEASHFGFEGEDTMYKAMTFTAKNLKLVINNNNEKIEPSLLEEVGHALELPLHWRMPRLETRWNIDLCWRKKKINPALLELAKLDFNMVQALHQKELIRLSRWWEDLGMANKLSFLRDRLVESFFWSIGIAHEPQFECCRESLTKVGIMILTIDDIYDICDSIDELELFTATVERWDINAMELLPDYMKIGFLALHTTTNELVDTTMKEQGFNPLPCLKQVWVDTCKSMLVEAKWSKSRYMPTLEEYLASAWISSTTGVILANSFFGSKQKITSAALQGLCLQSESDGLIYNSSIILRLSNDLVERERADVPSAIPCYMSETNASEKVAREKIRTLIKEAWRKMNKSVANSPFESSFVKIIQNHTRTIHCVYQHGDGMSVQDYMKEKIMAVLFKPIAY